MEAWLFNLMAKPPTSTTSLSTPDLLYFSCIQTIVKSALTTEKDTERLAFIARRVCWWQSADATLADTPRFLCQVMVFGTWEDICVVLDHHGKAAFRVALGSAPPGLFDNRSWHYWHHRLHLLPVPLMPQRTIPA
jgi:hypothetical protein